jgi:hypothetical protein
MNTDLGPSLRLPWRWALIIGNPALTVDDLYTAS